MTATATTTAPLAADAFKVWTGCLACYNNNHLIGEWTPAAEAPTTEEEFREVVGVEKLRRAGHFSDFVEHEELWCFDIEGAPHHREMSPMQAQQYAEYLGDLREDEMEPLQEWLSNYGDELDWDSVQKFRESYAGLWDSLKDYAWTLYEDAELPEWADCYRGALVEAATNDLIADGSHWTSYASGRAAVHVFRSM